MAGVPHRAPDSWLRAGEDLRTIIVIHWAHSRDLGCTHSHRWHGPSQAGFSGDTQPWKTLLPVARVTDWGFPGLCSQLLTLTARISLTRYSLRDHVCPRCCSLPSTHFGQGGRLTS